MRMATRVERFQRGDYPPVCARSGLPADKLVPVEAARTAAWPWTFLPLSIVAWLVTSMAVWEDRIWGLLPFATGHVRGVSATWDRRERVVIVQGVHPDFVTAARQAQYGQGPADDA